MLADKTESTGLDVTSVEAFIGSVVSLILADVLVQENWEIKRSTVQHIVMTLDIAINLMVIIEPMRLKCFN